MMHAQATHARSGPRGDQSVEVIIDHGYRPQSIVARAGVPLRLIFRRRDPDDCMDRVVFSSPHIDRRLAQGTTTTIVLPAQPPGEVRFTCGMGRYHGQIELRADGSSAVSTLLAATRRGMDRARRFIRGPAEQTVATTHGDPPRPLPPGRDESTGVRNGRALVRSTTTRELRP